MLLRAFHDRGHPALNVLYTRRCFSQKRPNQVTVKHPTGRDAIEARIVTCNIFHSRDKRILMMRARAASSVPSMSNSTSALAAAILFMVKPAPR